MIRFERRTTTTLGIILVVFLQRLQCGWSQNNDAKTTCQPGPHTVATDDVTVAPDRFRVHWTTSASPTDVITIEVERAWSPIGADRFYQLVRDNYYNCASFFRVVPYFVVQFGLAAEPVETHKWSNLDIRDDAIGMQTNDVGMVSYAMAGPNTRTTQVFVNLANNGQLDSMGFTPFGKIIAGMDLFAKLYNPTPGGSGGVSQAELESMGNEWLLTRYPEIDIILNTVLEVVDSPNHDDTAAVPSENDINNNNNEESSNHDDTAAVPSENNNFNNEDLGEHYDVDGMNSENNNAGNAAETSENQNEEWNDPNAGDAVNSENNNNEESSNPGADAVTNENENNNNDNNEGVSDPAVIFGSDDEDSSVPGDQTNGEDAVIDFLPEVNEEVVPEPASESVSSGNNDYDFSNNNNNNNNNNNDIQEEPEAHTYGGQNQKPLDATAEQMVFTAPEQEPVYRGAVALAVALEVFLVLVLLFIQ